MSRLPVLSGRAARRAFERAGWEFARQKGSHMILKKPGSVAHLSIPDHDTLDRGTLRRLIRDSGLTLEEFNTLAD
jgi:predicted RNA binding protein YcfA (HicA-like mRNA interferase family)